jgi:UDP-N-acetylglucosamine 2-epimerase (non-hydrolysing)
VRVLAVVGTRPEAIKMFSPVEAMRAREDRFEVFLASSGQHSELLDDALRLFGMVVDEDLAAMRHDQQPVDVVWTVGHWVSDLMRRLRPDVVLVQGDTATAMAAGLAAFYSSARVAHIEAGLRTYDNRAPWPEEVNRRVLDVLADIHFAPTDLSAANLLREGTARESVHITGNTGIDALQWALGRPHPADPPAAGERRVLVTTHRRESIPEGVEAISRATSRLAWRHPDVRFQFVQHPSPAVRRVVRHTLAADPPANVELLEPCDYVSFVHMLADAHLVLTDSGGIQEEAPALGTPVLVVNPRTARQEGVEAGTATVVGTDVDDIFSAAGRLLDDPAHHARMARSHDAYGDGRAGERIAGVLEQLEHANWQEPAATGVLASA